MAGGPVRPGAVTRLFCELSSAAPRSGRDSSGRGRWDPSVPEMMHSDRWLNLGDGPADCEAAGIEESPIQKTPFPIWTSQSLQVAHIWTFPPSTPFSWALESPGLWKAMLTEDLVAFFGLDTWFGSLKNGQDPITCYCRSILQMAKSQTQSCKALAVQVSLRRHWTIPPGSRITRQDLSMSFCTIMEEN